MAIIAHNMCLMKMDKSEVLLRMDKVIRIASLRNSYTFERRFNDFVYQKALKVLTYIVKLVSPSSISEDLRNEQILSYLQWYQLCQGHKGGKFRFWTAWIFYSCPKSKFSLVFNCICKRLTNLDMQAGFFQPKPKLLVVAKTLLKL